MGCHDSVTAAAEAGMYNRVMSDSGSDGQLSRHSLYSVAGSIKLPHVARSHCCLYARSSRKYRINLLAYQSSFPTLYPHAKYVD